MFDKKAYMKVYNKVHHKKWYLAHREQVNTTARKRYLLHPEKQRVATKKWAIEHPGQARKTHKLGSRKYRATHPKQIKENRRKHYLAHTEQMKKKQIQFRQTPKGKEGIRKYNAIRKQFGFIPLNKYFKGSEAHHVDLERVIYIPEKLHRSVWHSVTLNINMDKINKLAFEFLNSAVKGRPQE